MKLAGDFVLCSNQRNHKEKNEQQDFSRTNKHFAIESNILNMKKKFSSVSKLITSVTYKED